ncbi:unnamed protein product [Bursaphelenchus okinawaensis]|uniref:Uncharacterized protein n=1 Tax=Bursaphelenchus okinawaensis TaxID=465554 RepID=A0A811KHG5_9BILA|nr:unnamed protein product [Bursaphelenchus okinawaensis]CAG9102991.1 unnamed protein product [Bursaphelenchus okinawaensis]
MTEKQDIGKNREKNREKERFQMYWDPETKTEATVPEAASLFRHPDAHGGVCECTFSRLSLYRVFRLFL